MSGGFYGSPYFLVRSLEAGSVERQLVLLAKELQHRGLRPFPINPYSQARYCYLN